MGAGADAAGERRDTARAGKRPVLRLPFVIDGRPLEARGDVEQQLIEAPFGDVLLPRCSALPEASAELGLATTPTQEIIGFLHRVGRLWENDEYVRRRVYVRQMQQLLGYSEQMAVVEADLIAATLRGSSRLWDTLEVELGSRFVLDRWERREDCETRALPKGTVVHVLSGNVPIASVLSILRSLITKNRTWVKLASGDPVTPTQLALSFLDADPEHPVSRALRTLYWPNDSAQGAALLRAADGVCVWGGAEAVEWTHRSARPGVEILVFGPKRSLAVARPESDEQYETAARLIAHDVAMYDQQGCFSTRNLFFLGDVGRFVPLLARALGASEKSLGLPRRDLDRSAGAALTRLHHSFFEAECALSESGTAQVIVAEPQQVARHPGTRTIFVHPVASVEEIYPWIDGSVQTVAAYPWELLHDHRDALARLGVSRIVEAGASGTFRLGATHDGLYPLSRLVRFVTVEAPASLHPKGMSIPLDMSKIVEKRQFRDLFV